MSRGEERSSIKSFPQQVASTIMLPSESSTTIEWNLTSGMCKSDKCTLVASKNAKFISLFTVVLHDASIYANTVSDSQFTNCMIHDNLPTAWFTHESWFMIHSCMIHDSLMHDSWQFTHCMIHDNPGNTNITPTLDLVNQWWNSNVAYVT